MSGTRGFTQAHAPAQRRPDEADGRPLAGTGKVATPPAMSASARKRGGPALATPKSKAAKRASSVGGRVAAAARMARLRAGRAAEERFRERR